jgi:Protein of unknown function (DUF3352)
MRKKKQKSLWLLPLAALAPAILGGVAVYWILASRNSASETMPVGANIIPQDALLTVSFSTDTNQWQQLRSFGTTQTQAAFDRTLAQLRDRFLSPNGYRYQQDIQPWVGKEITLAVLPVNSSNGQTSAITPTSQSLVMVLPIANPQEAKQALEPTNSPLQQGKWLSRIYKGVEIRETKTPDALNIPATPYSATVLDQRFLVVTTNPKATEQVIDTYQGGKSLAQSPGYLQALGQIASERSFGKLFINVPVAVTAARSSQPQLPGANLAQIQQQGVAATMTLKPDGVLIRSISWLNNNSPKRYTLTNDTGSIAKRLPANTLMMMSGGNLQQFWQDYVGGAEANPLSPFKPEQIRKSLKEFTNLELEKDLLSSMGGEFALALVPLSEANSKADRSKPSAIGPGLVFMVKASDRSIAEKVIRQVGAVMQSQNNFTVEPATIGNQSVTKWISGNQSLTITQGWLDDNVAFLSFGTPAGAGIIPQPESNLVGSDRFRNTVPLELNPNNGHFYIDIERLGVDSTARLLTFLFQLSTDPNTQKTLTSQLTPLRGIGVTAAVGDQRSTRLDIFLSLKKGNTPKPLPSPTPERFSQPSL